MKNVLYDMWQYSGLFRILASITVACLLAGGFFAGYVTAQLVSSAVQETVRLNETP